MKNLLPGLLFALAFSLWGFAAAPATQLLPEVPPTLSFSATPSPAQFRLNIKNPSLSPVQLSIYAGNGSCIWNYRLNKGKDHVDKTFNLEKILPDGNYSVVLRWEGGAKVHKLTIE